MDFFHKIRSFTLSVIRGNPLSPLNPFIRTGLLGQKYFLLFSEGEEIWRNLFWARGRLGVGVLSFYEVFLVPWGVVRRTRFTDKIGGNCGN